MDNEYCMMMEPISISVVVLTDCHIINSNHQMSCGLLLRWWVNNQSGVRLVVVIIHGMPVIIAGFYTDYKNFFG